MIMTGDGHAIVAQAAERANSRIPTASPATRSSVPATEIEAAAGEDPSMKHFREAIRAEIGAPIYDSWFGKVRLAKDGNVLTLYRSEEHTSELQSLMRISYAVFCLKKNTGRLKNKTHKSTYYNSHEITH